MTSSFDDETWERELFARRAIADGRSTPTRPPLDLDDVLARIDSRTTRARIREVTRVLTIANGLAAAAAFLLLARAVPPESPVTDLGGDDGSPNMTMIAPARPGQANALVCRVSDAARGESMCLVVAPVMASSSSSMMASLESESLSCIDEVTCGALGP